MSDLPAQLRKIAVIERNHRNKTMTASLLERAAAVIEQNRQMLDLYESYTNRDIKAQIENALEAKRKTGKFPFED